MTLFENLSNQIGYFDRSRDRSPKWNMAFKAGANQSNISSNTLLPCWMKQNFRFVALLSSNIISLNCSIIHKTRFYIEKILEIKMEDKTSAALALVLNELMMKKKRMVKQENGLREVDKVAI